jgi:hypothetical protein
MLLVVSKDFVLSKINAGTFANFLETKLLILLLVFTILEFAVLLENINLILNGMKTHFRIKSNKTKNKLILLEYFHKWFYIKKNIITIVNQVFIMRELFYKKPRERVY